MEELERGRSGPAGPEPPREGGDAIIGATLEGLRRAAVEVEQVASAAETLQRALLPSGLARVAGLTVAARYLAAGEESQVGGDWYDVIALRDGRAGIAIGDVVGHGIQAAARMARLQSASRAFALEGLRPSLVLERINAFAYEDDRPTVATLLYGAIDPTGATMRLASAGHPPALVIEADAEARFVEGGRGNPLGVRQYPSYEESVTSLAPGSTVLLYTDGLVESPGISLDEGLERLRELALTMPREPDLLCEALIEAIFPTAPPRDDVALLAARLEPVGGNTLELSVPAEPESLAQIRRSVARWLQGIGVSEGEAYEVLVACGEASANAVAHAYPLGGKEVEITGVRDADGVEIVVRDYGRWREPRPGVGARGIALMSELMDDVEIDRQPAGGTTVRMRRRLKT